MCERIHQLVCVNVELRVNAFVVYVCIYVHVYIYACMYEMKHSGS